MRTPLHFPELNRWGCFLLFFFLATNVAGRAVQQGNGDKKVRKEEEKDHFKQWLNRDALYIVASEEREVFEKLTTIEETEKFIEQFWYRRDPDPRTGVNEFREEHYLRVAYANENFASGIPGWATDRGRIYIIHGPPDEIESHPSGGHYRRKLHEGGGTTSTYPFVVWRYRYIEGIGPDVELEFVDRTWAGIYQLALSPNEKDAFFDIPGKGLTFAERLGLTKKADREFLRHKFLTIEREKDDPFTRYETFVKAQAPKSLKYQDLREIVKVDVSYSELPFTVAKQYFRLNEEQVLVALTLELDNQDLTFRMEGSSYRARLAIYGLVSSITGRIVTGFEESVEVTYSPEDQLKGLLARSVYQKKLYLDQRMRYKVDLVVKDLAGEKTGVKREAIIPPSYDEKQLQVSSLILSDFVRPLEEVPTENQMFVLGDVWIRPNPNHLFSLDQPFGVYIQAYNVQFDQSTFAPHVQIRYRITKKRETLLELVDSGQSIHFSSGQRVVVMKRLPLEDLEPGRYRLEVEIQDLLANQTVRSVEAFQLYNPAVASN